MWLLYKYVASLKHDILILVLNCCIVVSFSVIGVLDYLGRKVAKSSKLAIYPQFLSANDENFIF